MVQKVLAGQYQHGTARGCCLRLRGCHFLHEFLRHHPPRGLVIPVRRPVVTAPSAPNDDAIRVGLGHLQLQSPEVTGEVCAFDRWV